jgi:alanine racemase
MFTRPVWVEISRKNLLENFLQLRGLAGARAELMAVVKANAYGHGMVECSPLVVAAGADWIGITSVEEGVRARRVCPDARILIMSGIWSGEADAVLEHNLTAVAWEHFHLDLIEAAARRLGLAVGSVPVHLELDTGMSRQGVRVTGASGQFDGHAGLRAILERFHAGSALRIDAVMTHFSAPEVLNDGETSAQIKSLAGALRVVHSMGLRPRWVSAGNSATLLAGKDMAALHALADELGARLLLRPGLALYGYPPRFTGDGPIDANCHPVLTWKTRVTSLRAIEAGESAGYTSTFRAARRSRLALLPCGYADGISRLLSNRGSVLIRGQRAPIAGRVSMDQTIVDVTGLGGVEIGDEVVLIGSQGDHSITAYDIADQTATIPYEVLCAINHRVPRILVD